MMIDINPAVTSIDNANKLQRSFESIGLPVGSALVIERVDSGKKYPVQLLGFRRQRSLMVSPPQTKNGAEILLDNGEALNVRFINGKTIGAFECQVVYRCYQPFSYIHLSYPEQIESVDIRNAERVSADIEASVDSDFVMVGEWPKKVVLRNLSESGLCFVSDEFLGLIGHELNFSVGLTVNDVEKTLCLPGVIRNIEHHALPNGRKDYQVGVQFLALNDNDRLVLSSFVLARRAQGYL